MSVKLFTWPLNSFAAKDLIPSSLPQNKALDRNSKKNPGLLLLINGSLAYSDIASWFNAIQPHVSLTLPNTILPAIWPKPKSELNLIQHNAT